MGCGLVAEVKVWHVVGPSQGYTTSGDSVGD